jgi:hypothetical protein
MMEDLGLGLPGVEHVGDLIPFQKYVLRFAAEKRAEEMEQQMEDGGGSAGAARSSQSSDQLNSRYQPGGGGTRVVTKHYSNLSAETGADPDEIVRRYRDKKGLD